MRRSGAAVLAGAAALFAWEFVSWVVLPWHDARFKRFPDEPAALAALAAAPESGVYLAPFMGRDDSKDLQEAVMSARLRGPFVYALVQRGGVRPLARALPLAFLGNLLASFFAVWLLALLGPRSFAEKVGALLTAAWLAWAWAKWPELVWWGLPKGWLAVELADYTAAWALAGAAVAWTTRPRA